MSVKTLIQILILILITMIIGGVYIKYFDTKKDIVEEINLSETEAKLEILQEKLIDLEKQNKELNKKISEEIIETANLNNENSEKKNEKDENQKISKKENIKKSDVINKNNKVNDTKTNQIKNEKIKNLVKNVEYTSVDQKGNKFYLIATSGRSNVDNNDVLDLDNVNGEITSETRDTIYIESDYAKYNTVTLNSQFYQNVIINYQDKEIRCINFDINMETNKAIAYNDVIITDPKSIMKAGIVEFDLKTKDININPESSTSEINVITN